MLLNVANKALFKGRTKQKTLKQNKYKPCDSSSKHEFYLVTCHSRSKYPDLNEKKRNLATSKMSLFS